jgi:hypothetical protein
MPNLVHSDGCLNISAVAVELNSDKETFMCIEEGPNFSPAIGFSTMHQLTRHSLSCIFWPKYQLVKWNSNPVTLIWLYVTSGFSQK